MQYHIQTTPIWDAFKQSDGCPMCALKARTQNGLMSLYCGEAVMSPEYRVQVNETGFCTEHLNALLEGENKLGSALQLSTRLGFLIDTLKCSDTPKSAAKLGLSLEKQKDSCVICRSIDSVMERYAYTVAQMFSAEKEFPALLSDCKGFCLPHFSLLMQHTARAAKSASVYIAELKRVQLKYMSAAKKDLDSFTAQYDYRAARAPANAKNAPINAFVLMKGVSPNKK